MLMALDLEGVCASSGSACMVGSVVASHVLLAMGLPMERARSAIRFSLGKWTTAEEIAGWRCGAEDREANKRKSANMPLLRQLEFAFRSTGIFLWGSQASRLRKLYSEAASKMPASPTTETAVLAANSPRFVARQGANRIANDLRVEWNSRLKTAAGRADYRQKLISLNPRLVEHPAEIDRTLRHELAHILAQFRA